MSARSYLRDLRPEGLHRVRPCHDGDDDDYVLRLQKHRGHYDHCAAHQLVHQADHCDCSDLDSEDCCCHAGHDHCADHDHCGRHDQYVQLPPELIRHQLIRQQLIRLCEQVLLPIRQAAHRRHQE